MMWVKAQRFGPRFRLGSSRNEGTLRRQPLRTAFRAACLSAALLLVTIISTTVVRGAQATPLAGVPSGASCAVLSGVDPTFTNGRDWGRTIMRGHNAPGGWFGVDVCSNGNNSALSNGSSVSCSRAPSNWKSAGCAPGHPTSDGYGWTFQCVELVVRFSAWAYGDSPGAWGRSGWGNAPDLWSPVNHPSDFVMYPNGSSQAPVPGDILVWGSVDSAGRPWPAGPDGAHGGHIAVVAAVRNGMVITAEQNVKWGSEDHPSDTLALTHVGSRWILSGSTQHETSLPTYRWQRTMGLSRATYGWLHSTHKGGVKPVSTPVPTHTASTQQPSTNFTPHQAPGGLPTLAPATVVTSSGTLADLVWSTSDLFDGQAPADTPRADVRSLGAPTQSRLIVGQDPATVALPDGRRYTYVVGTDGNLYVARTASHTLGVYWFAHGAPDGVTLQPVLSATTFAGGMAVAALGSDGNLWWRAGPIGQLGDWLPLGRPNGVALADTFAIAGMPGTGAPLVLALGADGLLYERVWQPPLYNSDGSVEVPAGWSKWYAPHAQPAGSHFTGRLLVVPELAGEHDAIGPWTDTPLDVLALDASKQLWMLRLTATSGWSSQVIAPPATGKPLRALLAGVSVATATPTSKPATSSPSAASLLHVYARADGATYLSVIAIPAQKDATTPAPIWKQLPALPANVALSAGGVALPLAPETSVLVTASGYMLIAGGSHGGTVILTPQDVQGKASSSTTGTGSADATASNPNPWLTLGTATTTATFNDTLTATKLDSRWQLTGTNARVTTSANGTRLTPASGSMAALLQSAQTGDAQLTVRLVMPAHTSGDVKAGLVLYLDDGDWVMVLLDGSGHVSLCPAAWQVAFPCQTKQVTAAATYQGIWLRVIRQSTAFTGSFSLDGTSWQAIGQWVPT
ncbi:MAG: CHAP domain-containing protein, partial [Ktedonobacterales bacterium]